MRSARYTAPDGFPGNSHRDLLQDLLDHDPQGSVIYYDPGPGFQGDRRVVMKQWTKLITTPPKK